MSTPTILIVPGLRDAIDAHWQTLLATELPKVRAVPAMGRATVDCASRVQAIEDAAQAIDGPIVIVAHSAGCVMVTHWAAQTQRPVLGALLATPPDLTKALPPGYPTLDAMQAGGWFPLPRDPLPFPSIVVASRNDPLATFDEVADMAADWGSELVDGGELGHLNPNSGYGSWPDAKRYIDQFTQGALASARI